MIFLRGISIRLLLALIMLPAVGFSFPANRCFAFGDLGIVVERFEDGGKIDRCSYCRKFVKVGNVHKDAELILGKALKEGLTARDIGYRENSKEGMYLELLVYRFEERKGGNFAVDRPASVGFHMHLMENGTVRRVFVFDESQEALSNNLFNIGKFFRRGAKWLTVEELSRDGINQGLNDLLEEQR
ncbi:MAG: hypothetical protein A4E62_00657 [Syntrophorhabdus sp. PtaU1.Bin002]|nr:MAG: hypothetical protein A4E58_00802 [Syntrophorhabdus sp. PtaB.Bin006]OPY73043.1 MAG: hypothetical protein A4E62_00657 [Syntrophorhabdus sp. PtaU1.Bin002]